MRHTLKGRRVRFEILEKRTHFNSVWTSDFGAVPNDGKDDRAALQHAINASHEGETIWLDAGTYDVKGPLILRSGRAYRGIAGTRPMGIVDLPQFFTPQTAIHFTLTEGYGLQTENDAHDIRLADLDINSNQGAIGVLDGDSRRINVNHCSISAHDGHVVQMNFLRGLNFSDNFIHNTEGADRAFEAWGLADANFDRNIVCRVHQGFHLMESEENVNVRYNVLRKIHQMGIEIQGQFPTRNVTVEGNVFFDAMRPNWDTFAISVPANNTINTRITGNYLSTYFTGGWGRSPERRFGYSIEAGGNGNGNPRRRVRITGNTMGGPNPWFNFTVSTTRHAIIEGNKCYGHPVLDDFAGEPGDRGFGSVDVRENLLERDWTKMPGPPGWVNQGTIPGSLPSRHAR